MSQSSGVLDITFKAAVTMSGSPYHLVKMVDATTPYAVEVTTAVTDKAIGILQNAPKIGENAVVRVIGTSKLVSGTAIASPVGVLLVSGTDGRAQLRTDSGDATPWVVGIALEGDNVSANEIIEVLINCFQTGDV